LSSADFGDVIGTIGVGRSDTVTHAGVEPTMEGRELQDARRAAIATNRGSCSWDVDRAS